MRAKKLHIRGGPISVVTPQKGTELEVGVFYYRLLLSNL